MMPRLRAALVTAWVAAATALALRVLGSSPPPVAEFGSLGFSRVYGSFVAWFTPPYLYLVINGIILSIVASSRFQDAPSASAETAPPAPDAMGVSAAELQVRPADYEVKLQGDVYESKLAENLPLGVVDDPAGDGDLTVEPMRGGGGGGIDGEEDGEEEEEDDFVISRSDWSPKRRSESVEIVRPEYSSAAVAAAVEKPLVSVRIGQRKAMKPSPEGKEALRRVSRPRRNETLESTWRTITEGRAVPLSRHLKKADTWDVRGRDAEAGPVMRKSETFSTAAAAASSSSPGGGGGGGGSGAGGRLRREPSLGQDDLNRRVEAFIKKFNDEMRLQRQESFKHYTDMVNRGSHQ